MIDKRILIGTGLTVGILGLFLFLTKKTGAEPLTPGTGKIFGDVTEGGNKKIPVPDMLVEANGYSTTTDANGNWQLWLPAGTYTVMISKAGYGTQTRKLSAQIGKSNSWSIEFGPW